MFKFLAKAGMKRSEEEITKFLGLFKSGDEEQNGIIIGRAALIHYSLSSLDPKFSKLINSGVGENQGPIKNYILQLNSLLNDYHKAGESSNAAGVKLWNITFRCMSNNSFRHYGQALWNRASASFEYAKEHLKNELEMAASLGKGKMVEKIKGALSLYDYVPPQFRDSQPQFAPDR